MKKSKQFRYIPLFFALALTLNGCTLLRFEPMEEAQQKEEDQNRIIMQSSAVPIEEMVADDLVFERTMTTDSGIVLAQYTARLPQFVEDGAKSGTFANINDYYAEEFEGFEADCEWVFLTLQQELGAGWNNITDERQPVVSTFDYEMLTAGEKTVSFVREYRYTDRSGAETLHYFAEVFDYSTGWKLKFSDLMGQGTAEAEAELINQLDKWCQQNGLAFDEKDSVSAESLVEEFAVTEDELILCLNPFVLSADDGAGRLARLPLSAFSQWMQQE